MLAGGDPGAGGQNFCQVSSLRLHPQGGEAFGGEQSGLFGQFQPNPSSASSKTIVILLMKSACDLARKAAR